MDPAQRTHSVAELEREFGWTGAIVERWAASADIAWSRFGDSETATRAWGWVDQSRPGRIDAVLRLSVRPINPITSLDDVQESLAVPSRADEHVVDRTIHRGGPEGSILVVRDVFGPIPEQSEGQPVELRERFIGATIPEAGVVVIAALLCTGMSPIEDSETLVGEVLVGAELRRNDA
ncbi:MAG: hypothetical protein RIC81_09275 [Microcella pacifica]|uniref:hypothetical protein n=1 Tax=Microcella pacifica TaxID=2591847 RepID=UPI003315C869